MHEVGVQQRRTVADEVADQPEERDRIDVRPQREGVERNAAAAQLLRELPGARLVLVEHEHARLQPRSRRRGRSESRCVSEPEIPATFCTWRIARSRSVTCSPGRAPRPGSAGMGISVGRVPECSARGRAGGPSLDRFSEARSRPPRAGPSRPASRLHAGLDDRVADFLARRLHEHRRRRSPVLLGQRQGVQRALLAVLALRSTLVDLGRDDPLVRDDLAVLAVEADLEAAVGDHHVAPLAADAQVDLRDRSPRRAWRSTSA